MKILTGLVFEVTARELAEAYQKKANHHAERMAFYQAKLDALIAGFRAGITGASASTPFVVGQMAPGFITTTGPAATAINAVHSGTPLRVGYTAFAAGVSGQDDNLHYNATGQRAMSRSMFAAFRSAGPLVAAVPGQVTGLTATRGVGQVQLAWTPVMAYPAVTDYSVQKSTDGGTTWTTVTHTASTANTITVTGLTNGTAVTFQVAAVNASGTGAYSSTVTATPAAGVFSDTFTRADNASSLGTINTTECRLSEFFIQSTRSMSYIFVSCIR